jgi:hypothetical protein
MQGYNGGTHQRPSLRLDLVLAHGQTGSAPVLAPLDGSLACAFAPGEKAGCIEVVGHGRFGAVLCRVMLDRPFSRGEKVNRRQPLGTVRAAGMVGNNGTLHVHMKLHKAGRGSDPVPFSAAWRRRSAGDLRDQRVRAIGGHYVEQRGVSGVRGQPIESTAGQAQASRPRLGLKVAEEGAGEGAGRDLVGTVGDLLPQLLDAILAHVRGGLDGVAGSRVRAGLV